MARVTVVGAGLAGLATALYATTAGHHVVVLDRGERLGGRATSQSVDGAPFGQGLHLLQRRGPLAHLIKKISRLPAVLTSPRMDRLKAVDGGLLRPRNNVRQAAENRRALRARSPDNPLVQAAALLAGSGHPNIEHRYDALLKQRLSVVGEGWAGLVGRMASALDEVGVLIEANCEVTSLESGRVNLADGRSFDCDVVVVACGFHQAKRLLGGFETDLLAPVRPVRASTLDITLTSRPLESLHGIVDANKGAYVLDLSNVQPRWGLPGAYLSSLMVEQDGESGEDRMARLEAFIDLHAPGWRAHVLHRQAQTSVTVQTVGTKPAFDLLADRGILLAGEWVESEHALADAAVETGRRSGQNIARAMP
jgi:glycine/D-amino acid oxidase-like deaminating enzyme